MSIQSDILGAVNSVAGFTLGARSIKKMDESNKRVDQLKEALESQNKALEETQKRLSSLEMGEKPKILVDGYNNPIKGVK